ncbi:unnamed protein product [Protopolystoma xenopodis]|uniref:Uncharacterized protein n=1 Tax=Protopolystoma xenopodis TaxID=117903 RepID=A0A448WYF6_9PLAT|nr:unnamed protein product [Protopolystoma xenopodis]
MAYRIENLLDNYTYSGSNSSNQDEFVHFHATSPEDLLQRRQEEQCRFAQELAPMVDFLVDRASLPLHANRPSQALVRLLRDGQLILPSGDPRETIGLELIELSLLAFLAGRTITWSPAAAGEIDQLCFRISRDFPTGLAATIGLQMSLPEVPFVKDFEVFAGKKPN